MNYIIAAFVLIAFLAGGALGYFYSQDGIPAIKLAQQQADMKECRASQQITKDANDDIQKNSTVIADKLASNELQHPATCVSVAGTADVSANRPKHAGSNGKAINSNWLRAFAAQCETYRSELLVCTKFIADERQLIQQTGE